MCVCVAQSIMSLPAMQETWVRSLGREYTLEKEMVIHASILAWRIPRTEEPVGLQFVGSQRVGHDWANNTFTFNTFHIKDKIITMSYEVLYDLPQTVPSLKLYYIIFYSSPPSRAMHPDLCSLHSSHNGSLSHICQGGRNKNRAWNLLKTKWINCLKNAKIK